MAKGTKKNLSEAAGLRQRAEILLSKSKSELNQTHSEEDTNRLVHELEVHQIELEMQNAALSQSRNEVESALERYTDLYDFSPAGYFTLDRNGTILATNLTGSSFLGIERGGLIGKPFALFVDTESRPAFSRFLAQLLTVPEKTSCELTLTKKGDFPIIVQLAGLSSESGQECRVAIIDITKRKQAEDALLISESIYRAIGESIDFGIWICAPDGRNIYASQSFLNLVGMSQAQCSDFGWGDVLHPDDAEQTIAAWKECVLSGSAWDMEHRYRGVDGQWHDVLARGLPVRNEHGDIIYWAGINLDISRLKKTEQSLRHSEERHRVLVETMMQGVVHQDANGRIISMNPAAERILGKSCEELLGNHSVTVEHDTIRENGEIFPVMEHPTMVALRTGLPVCGVVMGVFNPRLNETRWIEVDAVPVMHPGDNIPFEVYSVFEDITERKQTDFALHLAHDELEQRVRKRTADLEAAVETVQAEIIERLKVMEELRKKEQMLLQQSRLAAMGEMINNIAHQWRQPLNALGILVQKLPIYYDSAQFNREFLEETTANAMKLIQHMSQTINVFRDFFRSDKEMVKFYLDTAVKQAVAFIENTFQDGTIKIDLNIEQGLMVEGYPNEFAQALLNILMNARDALAGSNAADATIIVRTFKDDGLSVVTVTDNAGGIPEEFIDRVFDPYFSTKSPDKGTGLGLFVSKTIIEKNMGGHLTVRNTGNGAEFRIEVAHGDS